MTRTPILPGEEQFLAAHEACHSHLLFLTSPPTLFINKVCAYYTGKPGHARPRLAFVEAVFVTFSIILLQWRSIWVETER